MFSVFVVAAALIPRIPSHAVTFAPLSRAVLVTRHTHTMMGGFEQKGTPKVMGGARVSLLMSGGDPSLLAAACRGHESELAGVIYSLPDDRVEVIAEGPQQVVDSLIDRVRAAAGDASVRENLSQLPVGGYEISFPLVDLVEPSATARIAMVGEAADMDYIRRHLQTEAVFNRGLKLTKGKQYAAEEIDIVCSGKSERLKSFVRWCYNGPPLARPSSVKVKWEK